MPRPSPPSAGGGGGKKRKAPAAPPPGGAKRARAPAAPKPKREQGPSLTPAQSKIIGVFLRSIFKPEDGGAQWDDTRREEVVELTNDALEAQGEARTYTLAKLHGWVGNAMYRHRQKEKKAEELRLNPPPPKPPKGAKGAKAKAPRASKGESAAKRRKRLAEEAEAEELAAIAKAAEAVTAAEEELKGAGAEEAKAKAATEKLEQAKAKLAELEKARQERKDRPKTGPGSRGGKGRVRKSSGGRKPPAVAVPAPTAEEIAALEEELKVAQEAAEASESTEAKAAAAAKVAQATAKLVQARAAAAAAAAQAKKKPAEGDGDRSAASMRAQQAAEARWGKDSPGGEQPGGPRVPTPEPEPERPPPASVLEPIHPMELLGNTPRDEPYVEKVEDLAVLAAHEVPPTAGQWPERHNPRVWGEEDVQCVGSFPAKVRDHSSGVFARKVCRLGVVCSAGDVRHVRFADGHAGGLRTLLRPIRTSKNHDELPTASMLTHVRG